MEGATRLQYTRLGLGTCADATGITYFTRDPQGRLIGERRPDGRYYDLFDGLGSVTGLTDSTGALVRTYRYEPSGTQRETTGTGPQAAFRFASGYIMPGGLYHYGQRYMDPATGRWTQQDPLDSPADLRAGNRYLYTGDDPINLVDPTGLTAPGPCGPVQRGLAGSRLRDAKRACAALHAKGASSTVDCALAAVGTASAVGALLVGRPAAVVVLGVAGTTVGIASLVRTC